MLNVKRNGKELETLCGGMVWNLMFFIFANRMVKFNPEIIGEQCIGIDSDKLAVSDENNKIARKIYHEKHLKTVTIV